MAALQPCPACDQDVSTAAKACPACGEPTPQHRRTRQLWVAAAVVVLAVCAIAAFQGAQEKAERRAEERVACILSDRTDC